MKYILVASRDEKAHDVIRNCFHKNFQVELVLTGKICLEMFVKKRYEFLFIDVDLLRDVTNQEDYKLQLQPFWSAFPEAEIIVMSTQEKIRQAVNVVKTGASDYLTYPIDQAEVRLITENIHHDQRLYSELKYLRNQFRRREINTVLHTENPAMKTVFEKIRLVAPTESTVLLTGETGTGKSLLANQIHLHSKRSKKQFIPIHCGAIPDTLLESELFGHEKGAFTGADRRKLGKFEIAHGGTIFLDEIGTITQSMQIKLLQILQDRTFQRVGGETTITSDVRILIATNADLKRMCDEGTFRRDLFYRLHVFPIEIPPLRERREDIPFLVETFLNRLNKFSLKNITGVDPKVMGALQAYDWPGNIRELENLIERAYVIERSLTLMPASFPEELFKGKRQLEKYFMDASLSLEDARKKLVERFEQHFLVELLARNQGRINRTAEAAGIGVRQLHHLMSKYGIKKEDFKQSLSFQQDSEL